MNPRLEKLLIHFITENKDNQNALDIVQDAIHKAL